MLRRARKAPKFHEVDGRAGGLPPPIDAKPQSSVAELLAARLGRVHLDTYAGAPLMKFPEDLRIYEYLLWMALPDAVIELGTCGGGSTLWLRDRLVAFRRYAGLPEPRVVTVDRTQDFAREQLTAIDPDHTATITVLEADVRDPQLPDRVAASLPPQATALVIEDTAHMHETTAAALRGFARFVPVGGWFVVEDGVVDEPELFDCPNPAQHGVQRAVREWLRTADGAGFRQRRDVELYGLTCNHGGYLQRVA